jgi:hypothetical protein
MSQRNIPYNEWRKMSGMERLIKARMPELEGAGLWKALPKYIGGFFVTRGGKRTFDPRSAGYDYAGARARGITPNAKKHWPSFGPMLGPKGQHWNLLLKGAFHKTRHKARATTKKSKGPFGTGYLGRYINVGK